ncbi:MAG: hypothetical protein IKB21_03675 [Clostridia bacterium]|nr:hypothetical protein [Clostridia bacterium]
MRKKSLAISNIVMLVAAVFCVAIFGAGAVWAYNANLAMKFQATFSFNALTLNLNGAKIYENGEIQNSNFTITPVAANTLEISATYKNFHLVDNNQTNTKSVTFSATNGNSTNYTLSLEKAVAYDVDLGVKGANAYASGTFENSILTVILTSDVVLDDKNNELPEDDDVLTFQIHFA